MTRYACSNPACPRREPVAAAEPPTCYTCGGKMAAVSTLLTYDPNRAWVEFGGVRINGVPEGPLIEIPAPTQLYADDITLDGAAVEYSSADALALGQRFAAAADAMLQPSEERPRAAGLAPICMMCRKVQPGNDLRPQICDDCRAMRDSLFGRRGLPMISCASPGTFELAGPLFISLHSRLPGERDLRSGSELRYPGYARQRIDRGADGLWPEQVRLTFPHGTATCEAWFFGIGRSETDEPLCFHKIHPRIFIDSVVTPILILNMRAIATPIIGEP